eukprot:TRINITY_DN8797_c0_g1_i3.p1 TRINITY_DN8797_c0_g1~~TRINITY_DN8797_c0_g1_i3.p1  ORF type:complete len:426 (-),score=119.78 TRINITY_DN8797_c0_g1_i3:107-1384(-)
MLRARRTQTLNRKALASYFKGDLGGCLFEWMAHGAPAVTLDVFVAYTELLLKEPMRYVKSEYSDKSFDKLELVIAIILKTPTILGDREAYSQVHLSASDVNKLTFGLIGLLVEREEKAEKAAQALTARILDEGSKETTLDTFFSRLRAELLLINIAVRRFFAKKLLGEQATSVPPMDRPSNLLDEGLLALLALSNGSIANAPKATLLFSTLSHGTSFNRLAYALRGYNAPTLFVLKHTEGGHSYLLGAFTKDQWEEALAYAGKPETFLFSLWPRYKPFFAFKGRGAANYTYFNTKKLERSKYKQGLGFGGNFERYRLWIDDELESGSYIQPDDETYEVGFLADPSVEKLKLEVVEVWGFGDDSAIEGREVFRQQELEEVERRRKVDRKAFGGTGFDKDIFFEKTFAGARQGHEDVDFLKSEAQQK